MTLLIAGIALYLFAALFALALAGAAGKDAPR